MLYFLNVWKRVNCYPYFKFTSENTRQTFPPQILHIFTYVLVQKSFTYFVDNIFTHKRFCKNVLKMNIYKFWKSLVFKFFSKSYLSILHGLPLYFLPLLIFFPNLYKQKKNWIKFCSIKRLFYLLRETAIEFKTKIIIIKNKNEKWKKEFFSSNAV